MARSLSSRSVRPGITRGRVVAPRLPAAVVAPVAAAHKNHAIYFVPGLQRGLMVLEAIAEARRPLSVTDIAKRLSLTRSSIFRLTYTLSRMGFLDALGDTKTFALGPRVLNIGFAFLASKDVIEIARPDLEALRDATNVSAHLAIRDHREVLYLSCMQTRSGFLSNMNVGARMPAHAVPMGWLLLSDLTAREIAALYEGQTLVQMTAETPRTITGLATRVAAAASRGVVVSRGFMEAGGSSVSAPIRDRDGRVVAAIDVSGPDSAFDLRELEGRYAAEVTAAAMRISTRLGYSAKEAARRTAMNHKT